MIVHTYTDTNNLAWSAGAKTTQEINRVGYITHMNMKLAATYNTASSGLSGDEDNLAKLITGISLSSAGRDFYSVNYGPLALFLSRIQYANAIRSDALSTSTSQTGVVDYMQLAMHLGLKFNDPVDKTVVIPAIDLPSLGLNLTWGSATSIGTGYTVTAATLYWTITEILLQRGETIQSVVPGGVAYPRMNATSDVLTAAYGNLSKTYDLPTGDILAWIMVMVNGGTSLARCNNFVTEMGINFAREAQTIYKTTFQDETMLTRQRFGLQNDYKGVAFLPLSIVSNDELGFNLQGYNIGEAKLGFTTSITDTTEDSAQSAGGTIYMLTYNVGK